RSTRSRARHQLDSGDRGVVCWNGISRNKPACNRTTVESATVSSTSCRTMKFTQHEGAEVTEETKVVQGEESATSWFTTYTVFARDNDAPAKSDADIARDNEAFAKLVDQLAEQGVTVRGLYDVSGMRAKADIMVWMWSKSPEALQDAIRQVRRSGLLSGTTLAFTAMGADRMAEFNPEHVPAFTEGRKPRKWLCFYPFVRSYDWYTLDPKERARMLRS